MSICLKMGVNPFNNNELAIDKTFKTFVSKLSTFVNRRGGTDAGSAGGGGAEGGRKGGRRGAEGSEICDKSKKK